MLNSIQLESVDGIRKLTLDAPRLQKVRIRHYESLRLNLVHGESVERLAIEVEEEWNRAEKQVDVKNLEQCVSRSSSIKSNYTTG